MRDLKIHSSYNCRRVIGDGLNSRTNSLTSSAISCRVMSDCVTTRTSGSMRQSAKQHRYSPSGAWLSHWSTTRHSPIGPDTQNHLPTTPKSALPAHTLNFRRVLLSGTGCLQKEDGLRKDPYQRQLNDVVAHAMLPLFESNPMGWNAVTSLPDSAERLHSYLQTWRCEVDVEDRSFVELILGVLK